MAEILDIFGGWTWWIIAGVLLLSELLATSIFLVWFGLAALTVGLADLFLGLNWQTEVDRIRRVERCLPSARTPLCQNTGHR